MADPVRLGVVGLGWWGRVQADIANQSGMAEVVSCYARTESTRTAFAAEVGCHAAASYEELLASDIDGVILTTPHSTHGEQTELAARAGVHVLVDKPFTLTVAEGRLAIDAAEQAGIVLMVGHQRRRQLATRRIRTMLDNNELGTPLMFESTFIIGRGYPESWRANPSETPLGGMTGLGVHAIDTYLYLAGPIERVAAVSSPLIAGEPLDHATSLLFEFASGATGTLHTGHYSAVSNRLVVHGSVATVYNEADGARLFVQQRSESERIEIEIGSANPLVEQMNTFVGAIRGEGSVETDGGVGLAVISVLEAAIASSRRREFVAVAEFS